jgi:hypothetical protein
MNSTTGYHKWVLFLCVPVSFDGITAHLSYSL